MAEYNNYFEKALKFIGTHQDLIDCHLVDFITERLWDKCLPEKLKSELESGNTMSDDVWTETNNMNSELSNFIQLTRSLSLESCPAVVCADDLPNWFLNKEHVNTSVRPKSEFMNMKKSHEIEVLGKVVAEMALSSRSLVLDAGAGKAYLSTYLSEHFDVPVLAIDSSQVCYKGAINRQKKIQKRKQSLLSKVRYVVQELNDTTDYTKIVNVCYPDWRLNRNLILTGLHTCGKLVHSVIKAFLREENIHLLFVVPCCYHLVDESLSERWNFSKNARMLAQQSLEKSRHKHLSPSLFYRAVLQVVLQSIGYYNAKVGRGGPLDNFVDYAKWALSKVGIDTKQIPSIHALQKIYQNHVHLEEKFRLFQVLRIYTSSVVEAAIILDRVLFLQNNSLCSKVAVIRLFDPALSPRRYAIFAIK